MARRAVPATAVVARPRQRSRCRLPALALPALVLAAVACARRTAAGRAAFVPPSLGSRTPRAPRRQSSPDSPEVPGVVVSVDSAALLESGPRYPASDYNLPIVAFAVLAAVVLVLRQDLITIYALYYFASSMEANWVVEAAHLLARLPSDLLVSYGEAAASTPVFTKACTSGVAYMIGDLMAQAFEGRRRVEWLDLPRCVRNGVTGFLLHGPGLHYWILFLEGPVGSAVAGLGEQAAIGVKIFLDQTFFSFALNLTYALVLGLLAGKPAQEIFQGARQTIGPAMLSSWRFWPFVHLVTYSPMMPIDFKVLWNDVMEIIWVAILSVVANAEKEEDPERQQACVVEDFGVEPGAEVALATEAERRG